MEFSNKAPRMMHIDINSCFATVEQQANPFLRGKPTVVASYTENYGAILAASHEAKKLGMYTGMRIKEARLIFPKLIVLTPDPDKYRCVHNSLRQIISEYTYDYLPKSIDEFVMDMNKVKGDLWLVGKEIKQRIKNEIGEWITVSIGIAPNSSLAKLASSIQKPDGLVEINKDNFSDIYSTLEVTDLCGINWRTELRLKRKGINNVSDMYVASLQELKLAFGSINGHYWYLRLRGYEVQESTQRRSFSNSYVLPHPMTFLDSLPIISKLVEKMASRIREEEYVAYGVGLYLRFGNNTYWGKRVKTNSPLFDARDFYKEILKIYSQCPFSFEIKKPTVYCFSLVKKAAIQTEIFENIEKKRNLVRAMDKVNGKFGNYTIHSARMIQSEVAVPDRIAFGR